MPNATNSATDNASPPLPVLAPEDVPADYPTSEPFEDRPYIEIRPTETPLDPTTVSRAMDLLFRSLEETTQTGLRAKLTGSTAVPGVEWLLVSDGSDDARIRYLVGSWYTEFLDDIEQILRTCLPRTYELRRVEYHVRRMLEGLPPDLERLQARPSDPSKQVGPHHPSITATMPYIAGVEYRGHAKRRFDWQTALVPFEEFTTTGQHSRDQKRGQARPHRQHRTNRDTSVSERDGTRIPLASLIEVLCEASMPVVYQVVCQPYSDWSQVGADYLDSLETGDVSAGDKIISWLFPPSEEKKRAYEPPHRDRLRIERITARDPGRTFRVSVRAAAMTREQPTGADGVARRLSSALGHLSTEFHQVRGHVRTDGELHAGSREPAGGEVFADICQRTSYGVNYETVKNYLPKVPHVSRGIVVAPDELPGLCLLDGSGLTAAGQRALAARPAEQTALTLPPPQQLARYRPPGMALCMPLTQDRLPSGQPLYLPPSEQDRHVLIVGRSGGGKSVLIETASVHNVQATDGPEIIIDSKGGGTAREYLQAYYAEYGSLEDVLYFDCTEFVPAFSFFDIGPLRAAGVPHGEAAPRKAADYEAILSGIMPAGAYEQAAESKKAINNHIQALFDPVHGSDAFTHQDLHDVLSLTKTIQQAPPTADAGLTSYFESQLGEDTDYVKNVLSGALGRVNEINTKPRLRRVFDHLPPTAKRTNQQAATAEPDTPAEDSKQGAATASTTSESGDQQATPAEGDSVSGGESIAETGGATGGEPHFEFADLINQSKVVIFDFGGTDAEMKRTLTLVILSELWSALKARSVNTEPNEAVPLVNLYLEEAADVAETDLVETLLSQGRSFGLSMTLGVQFPVQLKSDEKARDTYQEALNETATFLVGQVSTDHDLPELLATDAMPPEAVARRLSAMARGEWLVRPGAGFGEETPRPFLAKSVPAPAGHPASTDPLRGEQADAFETAFEAVKKETARRFALEHETPDVVEDEPATEEAETESDAEDTSTPAGPRVDSLLPHTKRLPECLSYNESAHALVCESCENRYDPSITGLKRAIECCHAIESIDIDDIPPTEFNLKLSPAEIAASEWSLVQLLFVQAVYNAQQQRYDPLEYDIVWDSMLRLQEYVGIDSEGVHELLEAGVLRRDSDHPHRLYSVPPNSRSIIGESYREGIDYGHGAGDLEESAEHVLLTEVTRRWAIQEFEEDPDSAVEEIRPYYELRESELPASVFMGEDPKVVSSTVDTYEQRRLDIVGLDADGEIVLTIEAERINHDQYEAIPKDYDKMAACDPEDAIWVVFSRNDAHTILSRLNAPADGEVRVEKSYSENTSPRDFILETPGATAIYPVQMLLDDIEDERVGK